MTLHWPQLTYLALTAIGIGLLIAKDGEPKTGTHNFWTSLAATAFIYWVLYEGGFFG